jgi:hypothetical protein
MEISTDDQLVEALMKLQNLYETIESLRNEITSDSEFDETVSELNKEVNVIQEATSKYVDDNTERFDEEIENEKE